MEGKNIFCYVIKQHHHRKGTVIGKTVGFLYANDEEEAEQIVRDKHITECSTLEFIKEVREDFSYTVYRSEL